MTIIEQNPKNRVELEELRRRLISAEKKSRRAARGQLKPSVSASVAQAAAAPVVVAGRGGIRIKKAQK